PVVRPRGSLGNCSCRSGRISQYLVVMLQPASRPELPSRSAATGRGILTELVQVGVLALVLFLVIHLAVQPVRVIGSSMYPTVSDQDYLIATTIDYRFHAPQRG